MRVGILGGTFDPPHLGHTRMARLAAKATNLDQVLFIPCHAQPLKGQAPAASPFHRAAMLALALSGRAEWLMDLRELERGGVSYTVDTLASLVRERPGDRFTLIIGADSLATLPKWRRVGEILSMAEVTVVPRGGLCLPPPGLTSRVRALKARSVAVSSTGVRERAARGESLAGLVARSVEAYIRRQALYTPCGAEGRGA